MFTVRADMFLSRFTVPRGALYRLYLDAQLDRDSAAVAMETTTPTTSSMDELPSRLKYLCPLHLVPRLNQCPGTGGTKVELDFPDYLAVCGSQQQCQCDDHGEHTNNDVSMGT